MKPRTKKRSWMKPDEFRRLREKMGLKQTELAELIDVQGNYVSLYENGKAPVSRLLALAMIAGKKYLQAGKLAGNA